MNKYNIKKIVLWSIFTISLFLGILTLFPILGYILIISGIIIPPYFLYKNYYEE